jgi:hypothetical protein
VADHHTEYLARAVAALTPEGRRRADELLEELAAAVGDNTWIAQFAHVRESEVDAGRTELTNTPDPGLMLTKQQRDALITGFTTIRDQEVLDDVNDWANAVIELLEDDAEA